MSKLKTSYSTISLRDNINNLYEGLETNTIHRTIVSLHLKNLLEMHSNILSSIDEEKTFEELESPLFINRLRIVETMVRDLKMYSFVPAVKKFIQENEEIFEENKLEIAVEKTLHSLKNNKNSKFYEKAVQNLEECSREENPIFSIVDNMKEHNWIPEVKSLFEFCKTLKGSISSENPNFRISKIYSPVQPVNENSFNFYSSGKVLNFNGSEISESSDSVNDDFKTLVRIVESSKVSDNGIRFLFNNSILDVKLGEEKEILVNNKIVESKNLSGYLLNSSLISLRDREKITLFETAYQKGTDIKDVDFGYKISSNIYEGLSASVFTVNNRIFIQKVNVGMKENSLVEATSANDAVNIVKNFIKFDISESVKDILESENLEASSKKDEAKKVRDRISFLMEKLAEVEAVESEIGKNKRITEAKKLLEDQIVSQNKKLKVLEGVEIPFTPSMEGPEVGISKLTSKGDLKAGKEYTIRGKGGYIFVGVSDDVFMFNHKNETDPTPIHMNNVEVESSISSGEITECY